MTAFGEMSRNATGSNNVAIGRGALATASGNFTIGSVVLERQTRRRKRLARWVGRRLVRWGSK